MSELVRCITKLAVVCCSVILILLFGLVALLIFAPDILLKILYYAIIIASIVGIIYVLYGLIGAVIILHLGKRRYRKFIEEKSEV